MTALFMEGLQQIECRQVEAGHAIYVNRLWL
jgi:hypothetical protein